MRRPKHRCVVSVEKRAKFRAARQIKAGIRDTNISNPYEQENCDRERDSFYLLMSLSLFLALAQLVVSDANHSGEQFEKRVVLSIFSRTRVGGNWFGRFVR